MLFVYKVDKQKYGKLLEEMDNDVLQKVDPIPKTVPDMCRVLAGWKNRYGNGYIRFSEANYGVEFCTTSGMKRLRMAKVRKRT